jgi:hypothetical protein
MGLLVLSCNRSRGPDTVYKLLLGNKIRDLRQGKELRILSYIKQTIIYTVSFQLLNTVVWEIY